MREDNFLKVVEEIVNNKKFIITSHVNPEGDAIGSALALYFALKLLRKDVTVFIRDPIPRICSFLPGVDIIKHSLNKNSYYDIAFIVDCGEIERVGKEFVEFTEIGKIINIDHHLTNNNFAYLSIIDPESSSTGELIYKLLKKVPIKINHDIAVNIYTAIVSDTGLFRYSNVNSESFRTAAELVDLGVKPSYVAENLYENQPYNRLKLLGDVLNTLEKDNNIASVVITKKMLDDNGATVDMTENFVNFPLSLEGVEVAVLFREIEKDYYKISLRSKGRINVADIAGIFNGGGHFNASGCNVKGELLYIKKAVYDAIKERWMG